MLMYLACGWRYDPKNPPQRKLPTPDVPEKLRRDAALWKEVAFIGTAVPGGFKRANWEFMFVLDGRQKRVGFADSSPLKEEYRSHSLWISPPGSDHGWEVPPGEASWVFVLHFASIPAALEQILSPNKSGCVAFLPEEAQMLKKLLIRVVPHYHRPKFSSSFLFQSLLHELSFFYAEHSSMARVPIFDDAARKVERVVSWFRENLAKKGSVAEAAASIGVSQGYLRRLFIAELGVSPKTVFSNILMERARELLLRPDLSRKEVATLCGFEGFSQFYRAFRKFHGASPSEWVRGEGYGKVRTLPVWSIKNKSSSEDSADSV